MLNQLLNPSDELLVILLTIACFRVYLEAISFDFTKLPLGKILSDSQGKEMVRRFHRMGFIMSVGMIVTWGPGFLLS